MKAAEFHQLHDRAEALARELATMRAHLDVIAGMLQVPRARVAQSVSVLNIRFNQVQEEYEHVRLRLQVEHIEADTVSPEFAETHPFTFGQVLDKLDPPSRSNLQRWLDRVLQRPV